MTMGQYEILNFLKKNKKEWFTVRELSNALKVNTGSINSSLSGLRRTTYILYREQENECVRFGYEYKYNEKEMMQ